MVENDNGTMNSKWSIIFLLTLSLDGLSHAQPATPARASGTGAAMIPPNTGNPVVETITDKELIQRRIESSAELKRVPNKPSDYGLLELSSILAAGGNFTLLPKGSILHCPQELGGRSLTTPSGTYQPWADFLRANRNWIRCQEVSADEVSGKKAISATVMENLIKTRCVIIATRQGNPITVLPVPTSSPSTKDKSQ